MRSSLRSPQLHQARSGQLAQLEATLGSLQEAVLIVDADNHILLANQALQAIFPGAKNILRQRLETRAAQRGLPRLCRGRAFRPDRAAARD